MTNSEKITLAKSVIAEIKTVANIAAISKNMGRATKIVKGEKLEVVDIVQFGYRKNTTDEYVPNAYMNKFGWKNCYYQSAECTVSIPKKLWGKAEKWERFLVENTTERTCSIFGGMLIN